MRKKEDKQIKERKQLKEFFPNGFETFPLAIRNKIMSLAGLFLGGGFAVFLLFLVAGGMEFWYLPAMVIVFGIFLIGQLYYLASNGQLKEVEGVIIDKEKDGYRKQNSYLVVQDTKSAVYRIIATDHSKNYKIGDIVRFYSVADALTHLKDGVYEVRVVHAIERLSAKITTDEEDEKLKNVAEKENSVQG